VEAAKADGSIQDMNVRRYLEYHGATLKEFGMELEQQGHVVSRYQAELQGYEIPKSVQITNMAEQVKMFSAQIDATTRYETLIRSVDKLKLERYTSLVGEIDTISRATAAVLDARTGVGTFTLSTQTAASNEENNQNQIRVEVAKVTQAAQEAAAKLDIGQAQWAEGQANDTKLNIAQLAFGFAQAAFAGADVSLGSAVSTGESISHSDSMNEPLDHTVTFN
jgi:hypothetical protein